MPDHIGFVHSSVPPFFVHFRPMVIGRPSVFPGFDDHAPASPPDDIAAPPDRELSFFNQAPQRIGNDLGILALLRFRGRLLQPPGERLVGDGGAERFSKRIEFPKLALWQNGFVEPSGELPSPSFGLHRQNNGVNGTEWQPEGWPRSASIVN